MKAYLISGAVTLVVVVAAIFITDAVKEARAKKKAAALPAA